MITVPDSTRKFPVQQIPYLDLGVTDLFEHLLSLKRANCPNWTDESASDFGIQILWLDSVLMRWLVDHLERVKANCYLPTATSREAVRLICAARDYVLAEASSASVSVTFSCQGGHPQFTIPKGTKVGTAEQTDQKQIVFETAAAAVVNTGVNTIAVTCVQGESITAEVVGSSDGTTGQSFACKQKGVVWHSELVEVFDTGAWVTWTRVDSFFDSAATDNHYRVLTDDNGAYRILFGNGVNGRIPGRGTNNVRVGYRKGGGLIGNVGAGSITELITAVQYVTGVTNALAASGGQDRESIESARLRAPAFIRTLQRAVTLSDMETLAEHYVSPTFGAIAKAKAISYGGFSFHVMIVPRSGGYPDAAHRAELQAYLDELRMVCTAIQVTNPNYRQVNVTATVTMYPNFSPAEVAARIRERLVAYISPAYQDPTTGVYPHGFGRDIHLSDLYALIDGTDGVDHCTVTVPTSSIIVNDYEIADIGTITLTVDDSANQYSFVSTREDIDREFRDKVITGKQSTAVAAG